MSDMYDTHTSDYFTSLEKTPFMELDPLVEEAIRTDKQKGVKSPYAFQDDEIVRRENLLHDQATLLRPAFSRDVEKIMNIPAYSRYSDKTQVFSFVQNDDISRRALHVQLVNRVARGIGQLLGLNTDLIEAIALGHDTGHTPFGHAGERWLGDCYHAHTGKYFNHNVHSVRVLDELYRRNISLQTLDGVLCHNGEFAQQKLARGNVHTFDELDALVNACITDEQTIAHLRPSTLEGCVVRVADMIAYLGKDRQDALNMGVIPSLDVFKSEVIGVTNTAILNNLTVDIVNNSYGKDHIEMSKDVFLDLKQAKKQNYQIIYNNEGMRSDSKNIVQEMFSHLYERLLADLVQEKHNSPIFAHHVTNLVNTSRSITAQDYLTTEPNQIVVDYIASMTDTYFISVYRYLFPQESFQLFERTYVSDLN